MSMVAPLLLFLAYGTEALGPGDHTRKLQVGESTRSYLMHIPPSYDPKKKTPVVLAFHGAVMTAEMMTLFSGLNKKADEAGFIVVYPSGSGSGLFLTWNAGGFWKIANQADDIGFVNKLLDDLPKVANIDPKRIFATGMSNGAMMCYRVAAELSERIAAIAPVAGTLVIDECKPSRPVPVMHFHGRADKLVPFGEPGKKSFIRGVEDCLQLWVKAAGCPKEPQVKELPNKTDKLQVTRKTYGPGKNGAEVVLYMIEGGGHTWPGMPPPVTWIGLSTMNISANDLMWDFFKRHPLK
jgi:polyhydroxybutyrate depolymerase